MNTPIWDFVNEYAKCDLSRLHMPGHKGKGPLGFEKYDITEFDGADSLFHADGIIKESEENASRIFNTGSTVFSCEGSSLSIRAMLHLAFINKEEWQGDYLLATRNAHSSLSSSSALIGFDIMWLTSGEHLSCNITANDIENTLRRVDKMPFGVYVTSPDYLGNILDIEGISQVCKKYNVPLLVDNAHGAYLKFLKEDRHPISLGANMCCDSAHKTLPVLTGGGYLHIAKGQDKYVKNAKSAMALYASTSPSYLILASLDLCNRYLASDFKKDLENICSICDKLKSKLFNLGYRVIGEEKTKITIATKSYGYYGYEIAKILKEKGILVEFYDPDYVVLMTSAFTSSKDFDKIIDTLSLISKKTEITSVLNQLRLPKKELTIREAIFKKNEEIDINSALGKVLASPCVSCPPAVGLINAGEVFDKDIIAACKYYKINTVRVVK